MSRSVIPFLDFQDGYVAVDIVRGEYANGELSLLLVAADGGPIAHATINLEEVGFAPEPGCFFIKNYSEHEGLGDALIKAGVVQRTHRRVKYGPWDASADEYRFTPEYQ